MNLLAKFLTTLPRSADAIRSDVKAYVAWQEGRVPEAFTPTGSDDVEIRNYLLHLRLEGLGRDALRDTVRSLHRFYRWLKAQDVIAIDPFDSFDFDRPFLTRQQIRRRDDYLPAGQREREIVRLGALNNLTQSLNRAVDVQTALNATLETLLDVMNLGTGWVFLLPVEVSSEALKEAPFALAATCNLPPGLEQDNRCFLSQPPDCHCQYLLRQGRLTRAVNVVECTRLQDSAKADGDNRDLFFHASLPLFLAGEPVGLVNLATDEWQFLTAADLQFLSIAGTQVSVALERAQLYDRLQNQERRLTEELAMARQVQASLLPDKLPNIPGYELAACWESAHEVAGDFYDAFMLPDGHWGLVIADVAGKGAPAALYMAMVRSLIKSAVDHHKRPSAVLAELNAALYQHAETGMFVTLFYAILNPESGTLTYANAGHDPPVILRADGSLLTLRDHGLLLGVLPDARLADGTVTLHPDDTLFLYTDGLTEGFNANEEIYGRDRLLQALTTAPQGASALLDHVLADLEGFTGSTPQPDDLTMLVLSR